MVSAQQTSLLDTRAAQHAFFPPTTTASLLHFYPLRHDKLFLSVFLFFLFDNLFHFRLLFFAREIQKTISSSSLFASPPLDSSPSTDVAADAAAPRAASRRACARSNGRSA